MLKTPTKYGSRNVRRLGADARMRPPNEPVGGSVAIHKLDPLTDPRWRALVNSHAGSSVFHSPSWLGALRSVYGYEPVVFTTCPADARLTNGLVFCQVRSWLTGRRLVSLPFSDHCEPLFEDANQVDWILWQIRNDLKREKLKYVEIRPIDYHPASRTGLSKETTYCFHRLDLRPPVEALFRNFHKDCVQRKIRRAEREQLRYDEGVSEDLLEQFYRLLVVTRRRQGLPPQPIQWFRGLIDAFDGNLKIRVASKNGTSIASILTISYKKSMMYKYGCSDSASNKLGGMALLFWNTIQEAKGLGFDEFEMGRSDLDNPGLVTFKEHWGAARMHISYWSYPPLTAGLPGVWKKNVSKHAASVCPDVVLEIIGRALYKHIG